MNAPRPMSLPMAALLGLTLGVCLMLVLYNLPPGVLRHFQPRHARSSP